MLIEFRVRNFRSFSNETVMSFVASPDKDLTDTNTAQTHLPALPRTVRSAVVYGANASGKSNLLRAMELMRGVVIESVALKPEQQFNVQPFRFDEALRNEPTLFEITCILGGVRHQYGFEFTPHRIVREWLLVYQKTKPQLWFDRRYDEESRKETFKFSTHLLGHKRAWQDATRPNALFLSTAVQLNSDQLRPLYSWFDASLVIFMDGAVIPPIYSTNMVRNPSDEYDIRSIMISADVAISEIRAVARKGFRQEIRFDLATGASETRREEGEILVPEFTHRSGDTAVNFDFQDESQGTQKLFALAGPLLDIIRNGKILVIDELDRSLHPLLVRQIVNTFQDPALNDSGAQLFFTTHDTSLLDSQLLRRDQIWLTEKNADQSTSLVPLNDFSPRKGEALERGYLSGRYGGVPILSQQLIARGPRGKE